jgi:hypothetical protein
MSPGSQGPRNLLAERLTGETSILIPRLTTRVTSLTRL